MKIDLIQARLTTLAVHKVGNKVKDEGIVASGTLFDYDEEMALILQQYFLSPFKSEEFFRFAHRSDLALHEVNTYCKQIFNGSREDFLAQSVHLLQHLYGVSMHPHIKSGELYVAHFRECVVDGVDLEAVGIFKSEHKDLFLQVEDKADWIRSTARLSQHERSWIQNGHC